MKTNMILPMLILLVAVITTSCESSEPVQKDPAKITLNYKSEELTGPRWMLFTMFCISVI
jgi:predicted component of type VI protein secretion system